jgi:hypothetical protein
MRKQQAAHATPEAALHGAAGLPRDCARCCVEKSGEGLSPTVKNFC